MLTWKPPESADYDDVIGCVDEWWGGRSMAAMLPRLFFDHFGQTSLLARDDDGAVVAFVIALVSPEDPGLAYVPFMGGSPRYRGQGIGREAYERVFNVLRARGCDRVKAVTSTLNANSQAFHRALGFAVSDPVSDYDGPGEDRVILTRLLDDREGAV